MNILVEYLEETYGGRRKLYGSAFIEPQPT